MLFVSKDLSLPICTLAGCSVAVEPDHVQRHLCHTHHWDSAKSAAESLQTQEHLSKVAEENQLIFRKTYVDTASATNSCPLQPFPVLDELKVDEGLQCLSCSFVSLQAVTMKSISPSAIQLCQTRVNSQTIRLSDAKLSLEARKQNISR